MQYFLNYSECSIRGMVIKVLASGILILTLMIGEKIMAAEREKAAKLIEKGLDGGIGVVKYQLENGLTVILEENHSASVVAVNVWVKVGSACEQDGEYGLAHVHEHMVFKGTEKRGVGVIASRFLDTALDVLSDAMENSKFDPDELNKELEVVLEEIRRGEDTPSRKLSERLFSEAYTVHPYGRPVIGSDESVRSFTRERAVNFYKKWYSPNNMVLVLVGDFDARKVIPKIQETFGALQEERAYRLETDYLQRVSQVTQEDIIRVARRYFNSPNLTAGFLLPTGKVTISEKGIAEIANTSSKTLEKELSQLSFDSESNVKEVLLDNGITVLIKENHSVPLFAARAAFLGGVRFEDKNSNGVFNFVSETLTRGTTSRSAEDIAREIESIAGSVNGFSGRNSFGVTVESLI